MGACSGNGMVVTSAEAKAEVAVAYFSPDVEWLGAGLRLLKWRAALIVHISHLT